MVLAVDVGNSNIVLGGYQDGKPRFISRIATDPNREADQYAVELGSILRLHGAGQEKIEGCVVSSVVPGLTPQLLQALAYFLEKEPVLFSLEDADGIVVDIERPAELGPDILASAVAVKNAYPLPAVIVDMGTATKFTAVDASGVLRGVAIAPGLFVSLNALIKNTSLLRGIVPEAPASAMGRNTADSMKSGVVFGAAAMLDGMVDRMAAELGGVATVVATGGAAPAVVPYCRHPVVYSDTLLLDGLYTAYMRRGG